MENEKRREYIKQWRLEHPAKVELYRLRHAKDNKEFVKKYNRVYQIRKRIVKKIEELEELEREMDKDVI